MRNRNIALLNNINLDFLEIKLRSLIRTPILWLAFLQIEIICSEKFRLESNTTPRSVMLSLVSISTLFTQMLLSFTYSVLVSVS